MAYYGYPLLFVLFLWWFSTGAVIYLNNLPKRTFRLTNSVATLVLVASYAGLYFTKSEPSTLFAYLSFAFGLLIWAWTQLTFYTGAITGPRTTACHPSCGGLRHFWHAVETCLYHELAAFAAGILIVAVTWGGENQIGVWTYIVLWAMHLSAKLNVVFGVRNLNEQFFPEHLRYLRSFLRERPMNVLFPFSVTIGTVVTLVLVQRAAGASSEFEAIAYTFYACLMALALIEHWFLVLPLPFAELWNWGLESRKVRDGSEDKADVQSSVLAHHDGQVLSIKLAACHDAQSGGSRDKPVLPDVAKSSIKSASSASILAFRKRK